MAAGDVEVLIGDGSRITQHESVMSSESGEETLLVNQGTGSVHVINRTAAELWALCAGGETVATLIERFAAHYQVDPSVVREDVFELLTTFRSLGVIDVEG